MRLLVDTCVGSTNSTGMLLTAVLIEEDGAFKDGGVGKMMTSAELRATQDTIVRYMILAMVRHHPIQHAHLNRATIRSTSDSVPRA